MNRRGHALVELVVALPILAIGGAGIGGIVLTSSHLLVEAERRFEISVRGPELLDSLRFDSWGEPSEGTLHARGREVRWAWDGAGALRLRFATGGGGDVQTWQLLTSTRAAYPEFPGDEAGG